MSSISILILRDMYKFYIDMKAYNYTQVICPAFHSLPLGLLPVISSTYTAFALTFLQPYLATSFLAWFPVHPPVSVSLSRQCFVPCPFSTRLQPLSDISVLLLTTSSYASPVTSMSHSQLCRLYSTNIYSQLSGLA